MNSASFLFFDGNCYIWEMRLFEDRPEYEAPRCELVPYALQQLIAGSSTEGISSDIDPFIGGGEYEW